MKLTKIFGILFCSLFLLACNNNDDQVHQNIDQIIHFYIKNSSGKDMLIPNDTMGYSGRISLYDQNAITTLKPIASPAYLVDNENINYAQYIAGATRLLVDSINENQKTYRSDFLMVLRTGETGAQNNENEVSITYNWTPILFQVSKISFNGEEVFTKNQQQENIVVLEK